MVEDIKSLLGKFLASSKASRSSTWDDPIMELRIYLRKKDAEMKFPKLDRVFLHSGVYALFV
jgi:hypothetical protein